MMLSICVDQEQFIESQWLNFFFKGRKVRLKSQTSLYLDRPMSANALSSFFKLMARSEPTTFSNPTLTIRLNFDLIWMSLKYKN